MWWKSAKNFSIIVGNGFVGRNRFICIGITSTVKSQSGDGVRRRSLILVSVTDGEELGSSGITAKRPRCTHGDVGPYVPAKNSKNSIVNFSCMMKRMKCEIHFAMEKNPSFPTEFFVKVFVIATLLCNLRCIFHCMVTDVALLWCFCCCIRFVFVCVYLEVWSEIVRVTSARLVARANWVVDKSGNGPSVCLMYHFQPLSIYKFHIWKHHQN